MFVLCLNANICIRPQQLWKPSLYPINILLCFEDREVSSLRMAIVRPHGRLLGLIHPMPKPAAANLMASCKGKDHGLCKCHITVQIGTADTKESLYRDLVMWIAQADIMGGPAHAQASIDLRRKYGLETKPTKAK